jgi:hypothetical protein
VTERGLFELLRSVLVAGLASRSVVATVQQAYQPEQQGAPEGPAILLSLIDSEPVGMPKRSDRPNPDVEGEMLHTETQWMLTRFQIGAIATQKPTEPNRRTAGDHVNLARQIVQSSAGMALLNAAGVRILQPRNARNPQFLNEKARFQASPSFDLVLTHELTETTSIPAIMPPVTFEIKRV